MDAELFGNSLNKISGRKIMLNFKICEDLSFFNVHLYSGNPLDINIQVFQVSYLYCIYLIFRFFFY